ncbi:protein-export chaperone SecB [Rubellimicrobium sp. CFH 75288]|uniref:protein-export chaperone SecB n=1 Tax=Rubellimicrobium sp. CFH 75288 TaxID=2697034 RepID=UPI001413574C|nr:protein-export chaperone SecB [Rubellimicrobium sp. CFH 75288]NAZ37776.1 protein-export chaperone SecB [Rubellimicrobium sp. CFH 75288]
MQDSPAAPEGGAAPSAPQPVRITQRILAQYVRDLSFENVLARKGVGGDLTPEIQVQVALDAKRRSAENQYEVATKLNATSRTKAAGEVLFALEIDYVGVFEIAGVPEDQLHAYLLIECPRQTFPFLRRIVSDVTRDGGFPALNLDSIDFVALYRAEIARRAQAAGQAGAATAPANGGPAGTGGTGSAPPRLDA